MTTGRESRGSTSSGPAAVEGRMRAAQTPEEAQQYSELIEALLIVTINQDNPVTLGKIGDFTGTEVTKDDLIEARGRGSK
jgi:hypothetical protein